MKTKIQTLILTMIATTTVFAAHADTIQLNGSSADSLDIILRRSIQPTTVKALDLWLYEALRITCTLQIPAPGAAFLRSCSIMDRNQKNHQVPKQDASQLISILEEVGYQPQVIQGATVLVTGNVSCSTRQGWWPTACFLEELK